MQNRNLAVNLAPGSPQWRVLLALRAGAADLDRLADELDLHRTVVHSHLRRLQAAGLVVADSMGGRGPGRPRHRYRLTHQALDFSWPPRRHRLLASLLGRSLRSATPEAERLARESGAESAREMNLRGLPGLVELGWDYVVEDDRLKTLNCAFRESCADTGGLACHVHAGMLEAALGCPVQVVGAIDSGCSFELPIAPAR